jgi:hypothetical protein
MMTTNNTETTTTTASKTKVADRYHALVMHAYTLPEFTFTKTKKPTAKDCDELSEAIAKYEAGLAGVIEMAKAAPVAEAAPRSALVEALATLDAVDGGTSAAVLTAPANERDEARAKFFGAKKATKAHAYALLAAATGDGDRRALLRAKLAELPEAIRAGACRIATTLVVAGGSMHDDLKAVHDEQPAPTTATGGGRSLGDGERLCTVSKPGGRAVLHLTLPEQFRSVDKVRVVIAGDTITITKV